MASSQILRSVTRANGDIAEVLTGSTGTALDILCVDSVGNTWVRRSDQFGVFRLGYWNGTVMTYPTSHFTLPTTNITGAVGMLDGPGCYIFFASRALFISTPDGGTDRVADMSGALPAHNYYGLSWTADGDLCVLSQQATNTDPIRAVKFSTAGAVRANYPAQLFADGYADALQSLQLGPDGLLYAGRGPDTVTSEVFRFDPAAGGPASIDAMTPITSYTVFPTSINWNGALMIWAAAAPPAQLNDILYFYAGWGASPTSVEITDFFGWAAGPHPSSGAFFIAGENADTKPTLRRYIAGGMVEEVVEDGAVSNRYWYKGAGFSGGGWWMDAYGAQTQIAKAAQT